MKKLLLTVIVSLALCGSAFAQYTSYWSDFNYHAYEDQGALVAAITIDGVIIDTDTPNWDAFEVAAFVDGVCRGAGVPELETWYLDDEYVLEYGDPFPILNGAPIFYTTPAVGDAVTFMMYDHVNEVLYTECTVTYLGDPYTVTTGPDHDQGWWDPENPIFLNFTSPEGPGPEPQTFTKDIVGYGEGDNYWYFIASPVVEDITPSAENGFFTNAYDFFYFDQAFNQEEWRGYDAQNFVVENGKGYLYASNTDTQLSFTGTPYYGDEGAAEVELIYSEEGNPEWYGWNLVGNPFADDAYVYDERSFYRLEPETGAYLPCTSDDIVPMMEGIFVHAEDETDNVITFLTVNGGAGGGDIKKLVLNVNQGRGVSDRAILRFDGKATLSKLQLKQNSTAVYIPVDGKDYAIVNAPEMGEMPVNFKAERNGSYTLSFTSQEVSFNYLHLIDNMTGADVDLLVNPSYSFDANTTDYASRFRLVFATGSNSDDNFSFYSNGSFIISNEGEAVLQVVDVTGRILSNETINGSANVHVDAAPGVYMLRLINGDNVKVQKVVVK